MDNEAVSAISEYLYKIQSQYYDSDLSVAICDPYMAQFNIAGLYKVSSIFIVSCFKFIIQFHDEVNGFPVFKKSELLFQFNQEYRRWMIGSSPNRTLVSSFELSEGDVLEISSGFNFDYTTWFVAIDGNWTELEIVIEQTEKQEIVYQRPIGYPTPKPIFGCATVFDLKNCMAYVPGESYKEDFNPITLNDESEGNLEAIDPALDDDISCVKVNQGCSLQLYKDNDYGGTTATYSHGTTKDMGTGGWSSYRCNCITRLCTFTCSDNRCVWSFDFTGKII